MSPFLHDHNTWWYGLGEGNGDGAKQKHSVRSVNTQPAGSEKLPGLTNYFGLADHIAFQF